MDDRRPDLVDMPMLAHRRAQLVLVDLVGLLLPLGMFSKPTSQAKCVTCKRLHRKPLQQDEWLSGDSRFAVRLRAAE